MHSRATDRLRAQGELRTALLQEQFVVHYQPLVALDGGGLCQFEALVRWQHPNRGLLLPGDFLPVMVETGTIVPLGEWVIDAVCAQVAEWRTTTPGTVEVSVNLSHREFWSDNLLVTVTRSLLRHAVPPRCLVLEITESVIMADPRAAQQIMADLRAAGVRLHIDDFGTGHSSLHALRAFPVDAFKIDQSFVQQLGIDRQTTELVRIIVAMGRTLGLAVVAEGVETAEQAAQLAAMGCETVQGWLYAKALPGAEAAALLGTRLAGGSATAAAAASAARSARSVSEALGGAVSEAVDGAFGGSVAAVGL
jgi:EAL domain-containing protein (putative c-di-GMP-specific phosphodiesterase class I)